MNNKILIINNQFWPDKHNTARHISELAEEMVKRKWAVTALISNRPYFDYKNKFTTKRGNWNGVNYKRVYLPPLNQIKNLQRLISSIWFIIACIFELPFIGKYDAIILGTNPPFSYFLVPFIRLFKRKTKILMWGFDLYPEAIIIGGSKIWKNLGAIIKPLAKFCYRRIDVIVDIGPCMRNIYRTYNHSAQEETLPPWSFVEPSLIMEPHLETRKELFGNAKLTLLYSGTIGIAHDFDNFLLLTRELNKRKVSVSFCFAGFGSRFDDLKSLITKEDSNITFGGFVETDMELEQRFSSADIMLISLKDKWTGISVPSKYFGALAAGKAILFSGSEDSALCKWTNKYNLGFHLSKNNIEEIANILCKIADTPSQIYLIQKNAFNIYQEKFSKKAICNGWSDLLKKTINRH